MAQGEHANPRGVMNQATPVLFHRPESALTAAQYAIWCHLQPAEKAPTAPTQPSLYLDHRGMWLCMPGYQTPFQPSDAELRRRATGGTPTELVRACGTSVRGLRVLDACAGFGNDGLLLAQLGAEVTAIERDRLIWMMLHARVQKISNMRTECDEAKEVLGRAAVTQDFWDVVVLDPMFPATGKRALPSRGLQHLRELTKHQDQGSNDLETLLALAISKCSGRVVVKRRLKDPSLGRADYQIKGKSVRFDVYRGTA